METGLLLTEEGAMEGVSAGREKRGKSKRLGLTVRALDVGTMTGEARELVDMMWMRKMNNLCVQETRWKGWRLRSRVQAVLSWCRWKEKWSRSHLKGRVCWECSGGGKSVG